MGALDHISYFVEGFKEASQWSHVFYVIKKSKQIQRTLLKSIALNGIIYLGILGLLETFYPEHQIFGHSYTVLTGYPLYLVCLVCNSKLYSKIALIEHYDSAMADGNNVNMVILYGNMALFTALLRWIPVFGSSLAFLVHCVVMTYYCFEYKWMKEEWPIEKRLSYAEEHWSYYLGFGLSGTLLTFFFSTLKAGTVFALIYPSYIIMASKARPKPIQHIYNDRIPVFFGVRTMNQCITALWTHFYANSRVILPLNRLDAVKFSKRE